MLAIIISIGLVIESSVQLHDAIIIRNSLSGYGDVSITYEIIRLVFWCLVLIFSVIYTSIMTRAENETISVNARRDDMAEWVSKIKKANREKKTDK